MIEHGSVWTYKNHRCRCGECREAQRAYSASYEARHPRPARAVATKAQRAAHSRSTRGQNRGRRAEIHRIKIAAGCADCGYREHAEALHFDHLPGYEKLFAVGVGIRHAWPLVLAEIAKCDVVCANCHAVRTARRRQEASTLSVLPD